jgi:WD repeat and SOF domain-containing protein 1
LSLPLVAHSRVTDVTYTPTSTFIMSASDDGNVRLWKSQASASLGVIDSRERASREYRAKLAEKWGKTSSVRRIEAYVCPNLLSSRNSDWSD